MTWPKTSLKLLRLTDHCMYRFNALHRASGYRSPRNATRSRNGNRPLMVTERPFASDTQRMHTRPQVS